MVKPRFLIPAVILLAFLLVPPEVSAKLILVDQNATGDASGSSWDNACLTITAGLTASASGDEIWVKSATYGEAITMKEGVALYGGFPTDGSPSFEQRIWRSNETVINATGLNTHAVVGADFAILDGFTITGGFASKGGGVYCRYNSPTLANCTIQDNQWQGIALIESSPVIRGCRISGNQGQGISCNQSSPTLINCVIDNNINISTWQFGAVYCSLSTPTFTNCTISNNHGLYCSGIYCLNGSFAELSNCILWNRGQEINLGVSGEITVRFSCIQDGWLGEGNLCAVPRFVDPRNGDYRLQAGSPCIDRGLASAAPRTDIEGTERPGDDGLADMGAYEAPAEWVPGSAVLPPKTIYVRANSGSGGDGTSWENALSNLLDACRISCPSDEIRVSAGTYNEVVYMEPGVTMLGGFPSAGTPSLEQRDWVNYPTVIDGTGLNSRAVFAGDHASLDGFTITESEAGGVYCGSASPSISNCRIVDNESPGRGGGIYLAGSSPAFLNCMIDRNHANEGGAVCCMGVSAPLFVNCSVNDNWADQAGGAVYCRPFTSPTMINCTISGNDSSSAFYFYDDWFFPYDDIHLRLVNCVSWNPRGEFGSVAVGREVLADYCCIRAGWPGIANTSDPPQFVDAANGNYRLLPGSPCIDSGTSTGAPDFDLDGKFRAIDIPGVGVEGPGAFDMGCYEFGALAPGDTNGDASINHLDPFFFSRWWQEPKNETNYLCDRVDDATIDEEDLLELLEYWRD